MIKRKGLFDVEIDVRELLEKKRVLTQHHSIQKLT